MANASHPRPDEQPRPEVRKRKEGAARRLLRHRAAVIATQVDLKREAAERRGRKSRS
jgi:hypothetical protein